MRSLREPLGAPSSMPRVQGRSGAQVTALELAPPDWLRPDARVLVRICGHQGAREVVYTVRGIEWPWLVFFDEVPGGSNPANVLGPVPDP